MSPSPFANIVARQINAVRYASVKSTACFVALAVVLLSACGGDGAEDPSVLVYRSLGSVQCQGGGQTLSMVQASLESAGVRVISASCGDDGLAHAAVCGASDGRIAILEILQSQSQAAFSVGFSSVTGLPFTRTPCI